jgi:hypothetical protein
MTEPERLRQQAAHARRLAERTLDEQAARALRVYAAELLAKVQELERPNTATPQKAEGYPPQP